MDADCTMIGDGGPNIDGAAINVTAAEMGYALMVDRCYGGGFDGPWYRARCAGGQCIQNEQDGCCGCPPLDGGLF